MLESFLNRTGTAVIIDANLLLLLIIGKVDSKFIETFPRTSMFTKTDYNLLKAIIDNNYNKIMITPNILTEVSNLVEQMDDKNPNKEVIFKILKSVISSDLVNEEYISSELASEENCFNNLGLTDSTITNITEKKLGTITKDFDLVMELYSRDLPVLDFNLYMEKIPKRYKKRYQRNIKQIPKKYRRNAGKLTKKYRMKK